MSMAYALPKGTPCTDCAHSYESINYKRYCPIKKKPIRDNEPPCEELKPRNNNEKKEAKQ